MSATTQASDDTIAWITVRLHAHGGLSVSGTLGERCVFDMLDHAKDAVRRQVPRAGELYVPTCDVDAAAPSANLRELGDMPAHERGDA